MRSHQQVNKAMTEFFITRDAKLYGPFTKQQLQELDANGEIVIGDKVATSNEGPRSPVEQFLWGFPVDDTSKDSSKGRQQTGFESVSSKEICKDASSNQQTLSAATQSHNPDQPADLNLKQRIHKIDSALDLDQQTEATHELDLSMRSILVNNDIISDWQFDYLSNNVREPVQEMISALGLVDENSLAKMIAAENGLEFIDLDTHAAPHGIAARFPEALARKFSVYPIALNADGNCIRLLTCDPYAPELIALEQSFDAPFEFSVGTSRQVLTGIEQCYRGRSLEEQLATHLSLLDKHLRIVSSDQDLKTQLTNITETDNAALSMAANSTPIRRLVDLLILVGGNPLLKAFSLHFHPTATGLTVFLRVQSSDGLQYKSLPSWHLPIHLYDAMLSRFAEMSGKSHMQLANSALIEIHNASFIPSAEHYDNSYPLFDRKPNQNGEYSIDFVAYDNEHGTALVLLLSDHFTRFPDYHQHNLNSLSSEMEPLAAPPEVLESILELRGQHLNNISESASIPTLLGHFFIALQDNENPLADLFFTDLTSGYLDPKRALHNALKHDYYLILLQVNRILLDQPENVEARFVRLMIHDHLQTGSHLLDELLELSGTILASTCFEEQNATAWLLVLIAIFQVFSLKYLGHWAFKLLQKSWVLC